MQLTIFATLLTFVGLGLGLGIAPRNNPLSASQIPIDCNECREHRDLCLKYGNGDAHSGEPLVCTSYICRKWEVSAPWRFMRTGTDLVCTKCRSCGDEFKCDDANLTMPPGWN